VIIYSLAVISLGSSDLAFVTIGIASVRHFVLVSSIKSSLNTASKCSILRSNNKKLSGEGV